MNDEIHYITNKRKNKTVMNEGENDDSDIPRALYSVHKITRTILFSYLLVKLFKQRRISSVNSYKYLNKFIIVLVLQ